MKLIHTLLLSMINLIILPLAHAQVSYTLPNKLITFNLPAPYVYFNPPHATVGFAQNGVIEGSSIGLAMVFTKELTDNHLALCHNNDLDCLKTLSDNLIKQQSYKVITKEFIRIDHTNWLKITGEQKYSYFTLFNFYYYEQEVTIIIVAPSYTFNKTADEKYHAMVEDIVTSIKVTLPTHVFSNL